MSGRIAESIGLYTFFKGMPPPMIDALAAETTESSFEPREILVREGDPAGEFFLIRDGKVAIEIFTPDRGPITIQTLGAGEILGWSWLVEPHRWHFDAQAIEKTEVTIFNAETVRSACAADAALGFELMSRFVPLIVDRLQATRMQLLDLYRAPA